MKKRNLYSLFAASALMLTAVSCSQDEFENGASDNLVPVSFNVNYEGAALTRAIGDGDGADQLQFVVYDSNGKALTSLCKEYAIENHKATVSVMLAKNQTYSFAFWAQDADCPAYTLSEDKQTITVDYNGDDVLANDDTRDAFFAFRKDVVVEGSITEEVRLKRPFAQLNVGITEADYNAAKASGVLIAKSKAVVKNVATTLNLIDGSVGSDTQAVTFVSNVIPSGDDELLKNVDADGDGTSEKYYYLSMNYLLVYNTTDATATSNVDVDFTFTPSDGGQEITLPVSGVTVRRNYRTNIVGRMLTGDATFNVVVDERFLGDENYDSAAALKYALANGGTVTLYSDVMLTEGTSLEVAAGKEVVIDLNGHTISNPVTGGAAIVNNGTLTIKGDGTVLNDHETHNGGSPASVNHVILNKGTLTIENGTFGSDDKSAGNAVHAEAGSVTVINGGTFTSKSVTDGYNGYAYVFKVTGKDAVMTINDATVDTHANGMFACEEDATLSVNGGTYTLNKDKNTKSHYMVYTNSGDKAGNAVYLTAGTYRWYKGTNDNVLCGDGEVVISEEADINWTAETTEVVRTQSQLNEVLQNGGTALLGKPAATTKSVSADYTWTNPKKNVEIVGVEDGVSIAFGEGCLNGSSNAQTISFNNLTLKFPDSNVDNTGFYHVVTETYTNCTIENKLFLYAGESATFNGCTFKQTAVDYNVWTYGAKTTNFNNCTFNCAGKSVLIYKHGGSGVTYTVNFDNCTLTASSPAGDGKAAIEIDSTFPNDNNGAYIVNINNTTSTGFDEGSMSGSTLVNQKKGNKATISIDGKQFFAEGVSMTEEGYYAIENLSGLKWLAKQVNNGYNTFKGETVVLTAPIDLLEYQEDGETRVSWTPIGLNADKASCLFQGTFNGQGNTISNLYVETETGYTSAGFFGALNGTAKNFIINGATIKHITTANSDGYTDNGIAVVAGSLYNVGHVEGVTVKNAKVEGNRYLGGISGFTYGSVKNCTVENIKLTATPNKLANGKYDNGDKVGGVAGYFVSEGTYELSGNKASKVTIKGYRDLGGIVGCADGAGQVYNNDVNTGKITIDQVTNFYEKEDYNAAEIVGRIMKNGTLGSNNTHTDVEVYLPLDLSDMTDEDGNVTLTDDVEGSATTTAYGDAKAGWIHEVGTTIDGNGKTLWVENASNTWECAIYTKGGTIKNLTIGGAFRGIFIGGSLQTDLTVEKVVLDNVCYTLSADASGNYDVKFTECTLNGWTSYTSGFKSVTFTECNFGKGTGSYAYAYCRPYTATTFENCTFEEGFQLDATAANGNVLKNCKVGDTLITSANLTSLLGADAANATVE